jgi:hypothetical protein
MDTASPGWLMTRCSFSGDPPANSTQIAMRNAFTAA